MTRFDMQFDRLARHNAWKGRGNDLSQWADAHKQNLQQVCAAYDAGDFARGTAMLVDDRFYNQLAKLDDGYAIPFGYGTSKNVAKRRVSWCIKQDRAACGDGRWVPWPRKWICTGFPLLPFIPWPAPKPHYRWEPRR